MTPKAKANVGRQNSRILEPANSKNKICDCSDSEDGHNLVVCIDGTSNQFGIKNTNVIELYSLLKKNPDDNQHTWYNSGIGTYAKPSWKSWAYWRRVVDNKIDLAIAWNFESILMDAYRWLSDMYEPGDRIFLFGFSRGAYQVRALSGMIEKVGLIHPGNEKQIPFAFQLYADPNSDTVSESVGNSRSSRSSAAQNFKNTFSREDVKVHFVGVWDTVSSIGMVRSSSLPHTTEGMEHVCYFRHALALDERRVKFLPEYAWGGASTNTKSAHKTFHKHGRRKVLEDLEEDTPDQDATDSDDESRFAHTKEVWFAGTHSDIGGGNIENEGLDRSRPPLRWMCFEADALGLRIRPFRRPRDLKPDEQIVESLTGFWHFLECLPLKHLTYKDTSSTSHRPHGGRGRVITEGQKVHVSLLRIDAYTPKASLPKNIKDWNAFRELKADDKLLEGDMYDSLSYSTIQEYDTGDAEKRLEIQTLTLSAEGIWVLRQRVVSKRDDDFDLVRLFLFICADISSSSEKNLQNTAAIDEICELIALGELEVFWLLVETHSVETRVLQAMLQLYDGIYRMPDCRPRHDIEAILVNPNADEAYRTATNVFLGRFTIPRSTIFNTHTDYVAKPAFFPDGKWIVSGSQDGTVRIRDTESGQQIGDAIHVDYDTYYVHVSQNSKYIVTFQRGNGPKVNIWDVQTRKLLCEFEAPHTVWNVDFLGGCDVVMCVPRYATGGHIYFYDIETKTGTPGPTHNKAAEMIKRSPAAPVFAIAGTRKVTLHTFKPQLDPAESKFAEITSEADPFDDTIFSPDGKYIATLSFIAGRFRVYDAETGMPVGPSFGDSYELVPSSAVFCFSPNQRLCILYADVANVIRVWDAMTGKHIGILGGFKFHRWILFSKDGRRIVSKWEDEFRIWEVDLDLLDFNTED